VGDARRAAVDRAAPLACWRARRGPSTIAATVCNGARAGPGVRGSMLGAALLFAACGQSSTEYAGMRVDEAFPGTRVPALIEAARAGDRQRTLERAAECACVETPGADGVTPLLWVMGARDVPAARLLLEAGADPNRRVRGRQSAMSIAAAGDSPELLATLLEQGGDPDLRGPDDMPLLHLAVLHQRARNVELLLDHGADVNAVTPVGEVTAAEVAVGQGEMELAYRLLERGTTANLQGVADVLAHRAVPADSDRARWKARLAAELRARGIEVGR